MGQQILLLLASPQLPLLQNRELPLLLGGKIAHIARLQYSPFLPHLGGSRPAFPLFLGVSERGATPAVCPWAMWAMWAMRAMILKLFLRTHL